MFASAGAVADPNDVTIADYVDDTHAWIGAIRDATGTDCVWLLGHSEGGLVTLAAAQQERSICGIILVAAPGRPLGNVIKEQLRRDPANAPYLLQADTAIDSLAAGKRVDTTGLPAPLASLFAPAVQGFLINALSFDPAKLATGITTPILIIQGDSDLQVSMRDAELLNAAAPEAKLVRLTHVNHVLKVAVPGDAAANLATYADPTLSLAPGVTKTIIEFIHSHAGRPDNR
jgi:pimeloyl-ACP methyl ester carboxylesterase